MIVPIYAKPSVAGLIFVIGLSLLLGACSSSRKEAQDMPENAESSEQAAMPKPVVAPPPGTVLLSAEVIDATPTSSGYHCTLKITEIHKYGSGTPHLSEAAEIKVELSEAVLANAGWQQTLSTQKSTGEKFTAETASQLPAPNSEAYQMALQKATEILMQKGASRHISLKYNKALDAPGPKPMPWLVRSIQF